MREDLPRIALVPVDEAVLAALLLVAEQDADADEVTPPASDGPGWTDGRRAWFRAWHRARRTGLDGENPPAQAALRRAGFALADPDPTGAVRARADLAGADG